MESLLLLFFFSFLSFFSLIFLCAANVFKSQNVSTHITCLCAEQTVRQQQNGPKHTHPHRHSCLHTWRYFICDDRWYVLFFICLSHSFASYFYSATTTHFIFGGIISGWFWWCAFISILFRFHGLFSLFAVESSNICLFLAQSSKWIVLSWALVLRTQTVPVCLMNCIQYFVHSVRAISSFCRRRVIAWPRRVRCVVSGIMSMSPLTHQKHIHTQTK